MTQYVLKRAYYRDHIAFELPQDAGAKAAIVRELRKCKDKNNDFVLVTLQPPKRPRSTGLGSQNHHLNGHIMQICSETGNSYDAVKYCIKMHAVEELGYPYEELAGHIIPQGESSASVEECALLIEAAHELAAELGIILNE